MEEKVRSFLLIFSCYNTIDINILINTFSRRLKTSLEKTVINAFCQEQNIFTCGLYKTSSVGTTGNNQKLINANKEKSDKEEV
jgi:hypothetical protein